MSATTLLYAARYREGRCNNEEFPAATFGKCLCNFRDLALAKNKRIEKLSSDNITTVPELLYKEPRKYLYFDKVLPLELSQEVIDAAATKTPIVLGGKVISVEQTVRSVVLR